MSNTTGSLQWATQQAQDWLTRAITDDISNYAPFFALGGHVIVVWLFGILYMWVAWRHHVQHTTPKKRKPLLDHIRSHLIITMRLERELRSTTIIAAATFTVILICAPTPLHTSLLILTTSVFSAISLGLHTHALFRMQTNEDSQLQEGIDPKLEQEDVALCFVLNAYWAHLPLRVLRGVLLLGILAILGLSVFLTTAPSRVPVAIESATLLLLILREFDGFMSDGFRQADWNYKHFSRAMLRRAIAEDAANTEEASRVYASAPLRLGLRQLCYEPAYRKSTLFLTARDVVLHESTKLAWADHRCARRHEPRGAMQQAAPLSLDHACQPNLIHRVRARRSVSSDPPILRSSDPLPTPYRRLTAALRPPHGRPLASLCLMRVVLCTDEEKLTHVEIAKVRHQPDHLLIEARRLDETMGGGPGPPSSRPDRNSHVLGSYYATSPVKGPGGSPDRASRASSPASRVDDTRQDV
jgi:hypothetical protein